ncbi:Short-chain dehydrogenase/reductase SDR, partial [Neofusicoccum parvum]
MALSYVAFLALPLLLLAAQAIYHVFIHPLRRFPGPPLAAATKGVWLFHRIRGTQAPWITELHRKYGDVVRVAPDHLSYINAEAWKDIYGHKTPSGTGNLPKDLRYYGPPPTGGVGIISANDADHARIRRNLSHAFSEKALVAQDSLIRSHVELLVEKLRDAAGNSSSVDMVRMFNFTTFDIMADLTFGESLGLLEKTEYIPWVASIVSAVKAIGIIWGIQSAMPLLMPLVKRTVLRRMAEGTMKHAQFSREHVDKRLARETTRPDIWTFVLRNQGGDKGLSLQEMHSAGSALMGAGTETTATLLSGACWFLCNNPEKLDRLKDEARQAFAAEEVTMQALAQLPYLHAVLQESLRMFPPPPSGLPRVVPLGGATICGVPVPEK